MNIQFPFREQGLFRFINTVFLSGIILFILGEVLGIKNAGGIHIAIVVVAVGSILLLHNLLSKRLIWGIFGSIIFLFLVLGLVGVRTSGEFVDSYLKWLTNASGWNPEWTFYFGIAQICWLTLICYLFQFVQEKEFRTKLAVVAGVICLLVYYMIAKEAVSPIGVGFGITYILFVLVEWTQRKWGKVKTQSVASYMGWFFPIMLVYFIVLMSLPVSEEPYDWTFVKKVQEWIKEEVLLLSQELFEKDEELDFKFNNFSDEGDMGNSLFSDDKKVMIIKSNTPLKTDVYLTGKIFDTFDGRTWTVEKPVYPHAMYLDTVNLLSAVRNYDNTYSADYVRSADLEICYQYLKSDYLFAPIKSWCIEKNGEDVVVAEEEGSLLFDEKQDYGTSFYVNFYQMNAESEFFELLPQEKPDKERLKRLLSDLKTRSGIEMGLQQFEEYEDYCYANYRDEIILSNEVQEYLEDILKDADTDVEKLRAIEEELTSFTYTKEPVRLPETVTDATSYLEFFLLESKEGYCTHFATAFTLLARSQGIPARYVHGYSVPMRGNKEVTVTSSMAHAWPEVYIKNIGWIPFEPTPGYGTMRYGSWKTNKGSMTVSNQKKYYDRQEAADDYLAGEYNVLDSQDVASFGIEAVKKVLGRIGMVLLILLLGIVLFVVEERLRNRYLLSKMDDNKRYLFEVRKNLILLSCLRLDRKEEETISEYRERILRELPIGMQLRFAEGYERILYSDKDVDAKMQETVLKEREELLNTVKERNRFRYIIYKFFGR